MTASSHQFRVGLFAIGALAGVVIAAIALGWTRAREATVRYETYFDESVQGLELGAPVKYRGVRIGSVAGIAIAPDRQHVRVDLELARSDATRLQLEREHLALRTQLATQGITGVKFVDIDRGDARSQPPVLPFTPAEAYIPSRPSLLGGLQDNLETAVRDLPATLASLRRALDDIHDERLAAHAAALLANADGAMTDLRSWLGDLRRARLPERASVAIADLRALAARLGGVVDELRATGPLLASARRTVDAIGDVGRSARGTAGDVERTLRELAEAARAVRELAETLERDPDMLVRGRAAPRSR